MSTSRPWTARELKQLDAARELRISVPARDGRWRPAVPIWAVRVDDTVYARTWRRRETGWYGGAVRSGRACVGVPGVSVEVVVAVVADADPELRSAVDDAYRTKYGSAGDSSVAGMITDTAAATTLRLAPRT